MWQTAPHTFHIPVMGLAYTIDTPIKVARFGINSVISIIEDNLVEKMRGHYYRQLGEPYHPITNKDTDYRARRITDYLNLINRMVNNQMDELMRLPFSPGSEICKYFELLPDGNSLKMSYKQMLTLTNREDKEEQETRLRRRIMPGNIDVNIMTKLDKNNTDKNGNIIEDGSDAVAALRGFAKSDLKNSSVILSAGMNPRLFSYMERHPEFDTDSTGFFAKKIVIKVSDYRSAFIQGKMLAKKGLWVSEFRIESGLNCGGHAFASDGYLMGPILEEFKTKREELMNTLFTIYNEALLSKGKPTFAHPHATKVTVQGGIGTNDEDRFLHEYYEVDSTGWGTPFLLVPEATTVDEHTLQLLSKAEEKDVVLSHNSPLGIRFYYLKGTTADHEKLTRIKNGRPGSPCTEKFLVSNTEFSKEPICTASHTYQKKKIVQLQSLHLTETEYNSKVNEVLAKECLCTGLSNAAVKKYSLKPLTKKTEAINICPGPNIAYFSKIVSLQEMIDHIYGRANIILCDDRPHMFIKELQLYIDYWTELLTGTKNGLDQKRQKYAQEFHKNLTDGITYYHSLTEKAGNEWNSLKGKFHEGLSAAEKQLDESFKKFAERFLVSA